MIGFGESCRYRKDNPFILFTYEVPRKDDTYITINVYYEPNNSEFIVISILTQEGIVTSTDVITSADANKMNSIKDFEEFLIAVSCDSVSHSIVTLAKELDI
jgi:hypothetical protein